MTSETLRNVTLYIMHTERPIMHNTRFGSVAFRYSLGYDSTAGSSRGSLTVPSKAVRSGLVEPFISHT